MHECMHEYMHVCILYNIMAMANLHCLNNKWTIVEMAMASHVGYENSSLALITGLIIYEPMLLVAIHRAVKHSAHGCSGARS